MARVSNWGNYPDVDAQVTTPSQRTGIIEHVGKSTSFITRGAGLSYGDASLFKTILSTEQFKKIVAFDEATGIIKTEAGATLDEVLQAVVPKGWFLYVTPGTKFVTVGGAIGGDIHGKNHHAEGSFCHYVTNLEVLLADGSVVSCSADNNTHLFRTVCGGLGLAGVVLTVEFRLKKISTSFIRQKNIVIRNLNEMMQRLKEFESATYSVAWIDCLATGNDLGRGVLLLGEHATESEVKNANKLKVHRNPLINIPVYAPGFLLNPLSIWIFNTLVYTKYKIGKKELVSHYDPYFYPLDIMRNWNRLYGKKGFLQYQFVIPFENAEHGLRTILDAIAREKASSFLSVLKAMGPGDNTLSFPMAGWTLALDFKVTPTIFRFLDKLDKIILDLGGRIYLVKDARMAAEAYWKGYPNATAFSNDIRKFDPLQKFSSSLSTRLSMTGTGTQTRASANFKDPNAPTALILGATSDVGLALGKKLIDKGYNVIFASRKTEAVVASIAAANQSDSAYMTTFDALDFKDHAGWFNSLPVVPDITVCVFGYLGEQPKAESDWEESKKIIDSNYSGAVSVLNVVANAYAKRKYGMIVGFSSVAGDRGRQSNYIYGSAKAGFTAYLSGLRNRLFKEGVHVLTVKPGFMYTKMTAGLKLPKPVTANPEQVANKVWKSIKGKKNVAYVLPVWFLIMTIIRFIPEFVFKRLKL
ncbi:MAG TPA: SDR family oxidoreductase [Cyclobacteriaceae bacterium]|nr:SDR family oxidoreductase [Cyclobacteriaceae bacterium]